MDQMFQKRMMTSDKLEIPCFLNEDLYKNGIRKYEKWVPDKEPHICLGGITGSGKTYALKLLLAKISKYCPEARLDVCDFKGDRDFDFLSDKSHFYRFSESFEGFRHFYDEFISVQRSKEKNDRTQTRIIILEEWASMLNYVDKKVAEDYKKMLATLLMLGRSFNYHVILSQQRLDAESLRSRDNFNVVIVLGNVSKEVTGMLFSDYKDEIRPDRGRGLGYMIKNGSEFTRIIVPEVKNSENVIAAIRAIVD